jgi:hypothetical protein
MRVRIHRGRLDDGQLAALIAVLSRYRWHRPVRRPRRHAPAHRFARTPDFLDPRGWRSRQPDPRAVTG